MTPCGTPKYNYEMKRTSTKKGMERRKRVRNRPANSASRALTQRGEHPGDAGGNDSSQSSRRAQSPKVVGHVRVSGGACYSCHQKLSADTRVLFVEEEKKRTFCSEECISEFFSPQVERLERDYLSRVTPSDFSISEREALAHLRWVTLQEPDEIWCELVSSGDLVYTVISEFNTGSKKSWCVCICLYLRGEPSFLFVAFPTRDPMLVDFFRRGKKLETVENAPSVASNELQASNTDGLADSWTEDETIRAQLGQDRKEDDILPEEYELYQGCMDATLQTPDEVWSIVLFEEDERHLYHFIKYFPGEEGNIWYLVIARETEDREQIEILEAFPTRDTTLVKRYRAGKQEYGSNDNSEHRVIH